MSDKKHLVKVVIVGEEYTIRSDASPEHTRAVAQYVDQSIKRVLNTSLVVENHKAAKIDQGYNPKTVNNQYSSLKDKLGIYDTVGLVRYAIHHGLVEDF